MSADINLKSEVEELIRANVDIDNGYPGLSVDKAAALIMLVVKNEVAKAHQAARSGVLLGVASQLLAGAQGMTTKLAVAEAQSLINEVENQSG